MLASLGICKEMNFKPLPKKKKIKAVQYIDITGCYVKINKKTKEVISIKKTTGPYKGIDIIDRP